LVLSVRINTGRFFSKIMFFFLSRLLKDLLF
jgi:hypothetical protein